jgi:hypothetical protein
MQEGQLSAFQVLYSKHALLVRAECSQLKDEACIKKQTA